MIIGIGTDIIEIKRVEKALAQTELFCEKVFSAAEQKYCNNQGKHGIASYAGRWAAKEAIGKAMGCGIYRGKLSELEILSDENGKPVANLSEFWRSHLPDEAKVHISISHSKEYATADCVIEVLNQ